MIGWLSHFRRFRLAAAVLSLAAYAVAWFGVLPSPHIIGQWVSERFVEPERFPCEAHRCGCSSAEECWNDCCCHTPLQRLAWAIRHGVRPPESVRFSDEEWIAAANDVEPGSAHCSACVEMLVDDLSLGIALGVIETVEPVGSSCRAPVEPTTPPTSVITPAGCKGLVQLIVLSLPPARWSGALEWRADPVETPSRPGVAVQLPIRTRSLDTPTPPPRSRAVPLFNV